MDVLVTLLVIAVVAVVRSLVAPTDGEMLHNVATPIGAWLLQLQEFAPRLSVAVWGAMVLVAGIRVGRYGIKYSIYPAYTLMAIPIFGIVAAGVMVSRDYMLTSAVAFCGLLSMKYLHRCIMRSGSFGDLSLSMLWIGMLPLLFAPAALLAYGVVPLLVLVVRPSWRDWTVAVASILFPLAALCYVGWCRGSEFFSPVIDLYKAFMTPSGFRFFSSTTPAGMLLLCVLIVMTACSASLVVSDRYSLKVKARAMMRFNAILLVACVGMFFVPSCTATAFVLAAIPAAMLLPLMFVRMGVGFTEITYRLALLLAAANAVILYTLY